MKNNRSHIILLYFLFSILFLIPIPGLMLNLSNIVNVRNIMVFFFLLILLMVLLLSSKILIPKNYVTLYLFFSILIIPVSMLVGLNTYYIKVTLVDFIEIYKYATYFLIFLIAYNLKVQKTKVIMIFIGFVLLIEVIGVFQFFNILNFNNHLGQLYIPSERTFFILQKQQRVFSTFGNPNIYGSFVVIVFGFVLSCLLWRKSLNFINNKIIVLFFILTVLSIFFTTSRSTIVSAFVIFFYWAVIFPIIGKVRIKNIVIYSLVILSISVISFYSIQNIKYINYAYQQLVTHRDLDSVSSYSARKVYWDESIDAFKKSPILGHGPSKEGLSFTDNYYLYTLERSGVIGLLLFLWFTFRTLKITFKEIFDLYNNTINKVLAMTIHFTVIAYFVSAFMSEVWTNFQSICLLFFLLGVLENKEALKETL